jgi:hypothetical protein
MITRRKFLQGLAALTLGQSATGLNTAYSQNSGRRVSDGLDYLISKDYRAKEYQWEIDRTEYKNKTNKLELVDANGFQNVGSNEDVTSLVPSQDIVEDGIKLSPEYNLEDFKKVYNPNKWQIGLTDEEKRRAAKRIEGFNLDERKGVCNLYLSPYSFYATTLDSEQQKRFDDFNQALRYLYSVNGRNGALKSHLQVFYPSNGKTTEYYKNLYPWIRLDRKDIPLNAADRMLVFWVADALEKKGEKIFNWNNIRKFSKEKVKEDF